MQDLITDFKGKLEVLIREIGELQNTHPLSIDDARVHAKLGEARSALTALHQEAILSDDEGLPPYN
ncbi:MAG: Eisosome component PIL1/LSP1 family protein [Candidatus Thiodiazotropha endolucinida]|nr:Eisosome component PIL1/LSP1 family protein [Candidatus Thiodiazotropha taylori]MCW4262285.1 Eisosome component PIL1/LSP1 family protein [Candidatus Thiodiazotropha endolucinida]